MKALIYNGPHDVSVKEVPDAKIERPTDVLVKMTTTNICGSDLHMYEGRTAVEPGTIFGHENLGMVIEVGDAVTHVQVGDRVCLPFNISCGFCKNCERGLTAFCLTVNPGTAGGAYGYAGMGPYSGGQAEFLRVPTVTSTVCVFRRTRRRKKPTMSCCRTSSQPDTTRQRWLVSNRAILWWCMARDPSGSWRHTQPSSKVPARS